MYSGADPRRGGVSAVATQPWYYVRTPMQLRAVCTCAIFKIYTTPSFGNKWLYRDSFWLGPMHYRMHLNRSVMYYRHVETCLGDRDVPKLEQNHSSPHRLCLHNLFIGCALPGVEAIISLANCLFSYTCTE